MQDLKDAERLRLLAEAARGVALLTTDEAGVIQSWNRGAKEIFGYARADALGMSIDLLFTEADRASKIPQAERDTAAQDGQAEDRRWHVRQDGGLFWADGILIPLSADGEMVGYGKILRDDTPRKMAEERLADALAALGRVNAGLETAFERQSEIAEALQRSLLAPPPDLFPGLTVKPFHQGAEEDLLVGGDFFDVYAIGQNRIALVVGDVTGKGLEAATYTAELKFALRALLREFPAPGEAMARLNGLVCDRDRMLAPREMADPDRLGESYAAAAVVVVQTETGATEMALAGTELPFLLRAGGEISLYGAGGPLLGVGPGARYETVPDVLQPGTSS